MFKKIILILTLVLALALPSLACTLSSGSGIWIFLGPGGQMEKFTANSDVEVILHDTQPTQEMLKSFMEHSLVTEDWSDGKVVIDPEGRNMLAHDSDVKCE